MKKAQELSVLCDVDVALAVFTSGCRAYNFSGGNSFNTILERYQTHVEANSGNSNDHQPEKHQQGCRTTCENNNILQSVQRFFESQAVEQLDVSLLARLEHFLDAKLAQTRSRKTQLMMESLAALHEKERRLREEKLISEMINEMQTEGMINGEDNQEPTVELYNQWANNNNYPSD